MRSCRREHRLRVIAPFFGRVSKRVLLRTITSLTMQCVSAIITLLMHIVAGSNAAPHARSRRHANQNQSPVSRHNIFIRCCHRSVSTAFHNCTTSCNRRPTAPCPCCPRAIAPSPPFQQCVVITVARCSHITNAFVGCAGRPSARICAPPSRQRRASRCSSRYTTASSRIASHCHAEQCKRCWC